jgi:hypothetical protein
VKGAIKKEWVGKRKIRIYLYWRNNHHSFCWLKFLKDGSLSFGFQPRELQKIREWGSAVTKSGEFVEHTPVLRRGNVELKDIKESHLTFHPPRIRQKSGIVHAVANKNKIVDEFELDWFPVTRAQTPLYVYSGDISKLERIAALKGRHEIVEVPNNVHCLRMKLTLYPMPQRRLRLDDPNAFANIFGFCPNYIVTCRFYPDTEVEAGYYIASNYFTSGK